MKIKFASLVGLSVLVVFVSAQAVEMVPIQINPGDQGQPAPAGRQEPLAAGGSQGLADLVGVGGAGSDA